MAVKFQAVSCLVTVALLGMIQTVRQADLRNELSGWTLVVGLVLFFLPWGYIPVRNYFLIGKPMFPLSFSNPPYSDYVQFVTVDTQFNFGLTGLLMLLMSLMTKNLINGMGPIWGALAPAVFVHKAKNETLKTFRLIPLVGLTVGFLMMKVYEPRLYLIYAVLLGIYGGWFLHSFSPAGVRKIVATVLIGIGILPSFVLSTGLALNRVKWLVGAETKDSFMRRMRAPFYPWEFIQQVNSLVPPDATIFHFSPYGKDYFYWDRKCHYLDKYVLWSEKNPKRVLAYLKERYEYFVFSDEHWDQLEKGRKFRHSYYAVVPWLTDEFLEENFEIVLSNGQSRLLVLKKYEVDNEG